MSFCLCTEIKKCLGMPKAALLIFLASIGALAAALVGQYFFAMAPCILCYYQRAPYALAAAMMGVSLFLCRDKKMDRVFLSLCALLFLIGAGTAAFHSGVERHWWGGTSGCGVHPLDKPASQYTVEELKAQLLETDVVRCDVIDWTLFGLTLANLNIFAFLFLASFAGLAARKTYEPDENEGVCRTCCCRR